MKKKLYPFIMLAPFISLVVVFYLLPTVLSVLMAFTDMKFTLEWNFIGFDNFKKIITDPYISGVIKNTFVYAGSCLVVNVVIGFSIALVTVYFMGDKKQARFIKTIWMLPRMIPAVVLVVAWRWFFSPLDNGFLNEILSAGNPIKWIMKYPMLIVIIVNTFVGVSYVTLIMSASIKSIPQELFYAARVDGSKGAGIIFDIIIPFVRWQLMFVTISEILSLLTSYTAILLMTDGGPLMDTTNWALHAYKRAFMYSEYGYGSSLTIILVIVSFSLTLVMLKMFKFGDMMKDTIIE